MGQDLRELFKEERGRQHRMKPGHEARFASRLEANMRSGKRKPYTAFLIAASVLLLIGLSTYTYFSPGNDLPAGSAVVDTPPVETSNNRLSLGTLSPDLNKIEQYYVTNINLQLSDLEISPDNKAMVDGYMERLAALNEEYGKLNEELNAVGPNDQTINALINNLQLRLQLLLKLKDKLDTLKTTDNETQSSLTI